VVISLPDATPMPRRKKEVEELEGTSIKLPPSMKKKLDEIARYEDRSASAQMRVFLAEKIEEYFREEKSDDRGGREKK
jgi:predicted transcriptional regulator